MCFAERVATGNKRNRLLVIHRHALERLANVCVLTFPSKRHMAENWTGLGVHPPHTEDGWRKPLKRAEILYNSTLSIPERFGATASDSSGTCWPLASIFSELHSTGALFFLYIN